jgi:hypothetical protein
VGESYGGEMTVEQIKNVTTRESAVTYQLVLRVNVLDLKQREEVQDGVYGIAIRKAIEGIS